MRLVCSQLKTLCYCSPRLNGRKVSSTIQICTPPRSTLLIPACSVSTQALFMQAIKQETSRLHDRALVSSSWFIWVLSLLDLSDDQLESLGDILVIARAGLGPRTLILLSQRLSILRGYLSLFWAKITLVTNNDNWDPVGSL